MKAMVRRWLGLDGPGGLADVLLVKDGRLQSLEDWRDAHGKLTEKIVLVVNDHTTSLQRFAVYEQQVPSIKRVFNAMRERSIREQRKRAAEQALAAPPLTPPETPSAPPQDAVLDEVSAEVGGG